MVMGRVFAAGCNQGIESILDVWSADPQGVYSPKEGPDFVSKPMTFLDPDLERSSLQTCRARITTDSQGYFTFLSTVPGRYQQDMYWRPIHIHYKVTRKGDTSCILTTQQYFTSDGKYSTASSDSLMILFLSVSEQYFKTDPCGLDICRPGDPTLTVPMEPAVGMDGKSYLVRFDIVLQQQ